MHERVNFDSFLNYGFTDAYRKLNPKTVLYSYWHCYEDSRENNYGLRIDYFLLSNSLAARLANSTIHKEFDGSDHCPIMLKLNFKDGH